MNLSYPCTQKSVQNSSFRSFKVTRSGLGYRTWTRKVPLFLEAYIFALMTFCDTTHRFRDIDISSTRTFYPCCRADRDFAYKDASANTGHALLLTLNLMLFRMRCRPTRSDLPFSNADEFVVTVQPKMDPQIAVSGHFRSQGVDLGIEH